MYKKIHTTWLAAILCCLTYSSICHADTYKKNNIKETIKGAPNIVFFISDDHGQEAYGAYGNKTVRTPNLDKLAQNGVLFENAYATSASCSASRSVLLTGLHNHANGQYGHSHQYHHFSTFDKIKSLPVRLANAGYRTARVGKSHISPESVYHFDTVISKVKKYKPDGSRNTEGLAKATKSFIEEENDKPFFLYLATYDPHRYGNNTNSLGDNNFGNKKDNGEGMARLSYDPKDVEVPSYLNDTPATRREIAEQYEAITRVDNAMGILIQQLKDADVYDNTIIFYLTDNGSAMPGAKTTVYEPGLKLPLVVQLPDSYKNQKGKRTESMVGWPDLTPTILDLAKVSYNADDFHGRSFKEILLTDEDPKNWDTIYGSHTFHEITMYYPMRMVRKGQYKLILNLAHGLTFPFASDLYNSSTWQSTLDFNLNKLGTRTIDAYLNRPAFELYNLQADPTEANNLSDNPDYQEVKKNLILQLQQFQKETSDPWVVKWQYE